jgi:hypothetical protein
MHSLYLILPVQKVRWKRGDRMKPVEERRDRERKQYLI